MHRSRINSERVKVIAELPNSAIAVDATPAVLLSPASKQPLSPKWSNPYYFFQFTTLRDRRLSRVRAKQEILIFLRFELPWPLRPATQNAPRPLGGVMQFAQRVLRLRWAR
jgi:hypothetical protein